LIPRQKKELDTIRAKDSENVFTTAVVAILHRQGPMELIHEGHNPANMKMEFYCRPGECGLRIYC
jgi:hypothetical protein